MDLPKGLQDQSLTVKTFWGERWRAGRCTLPCFPPVMRTGTLPAGRLVALLISWSSTCCSSACFQRAGQWSPAWKNTPSLPEFKHQLCFFLCQLDWTRNFSLQIQGSVPPPILFLYVYCPLKGFIPKCSSVCSLFLSFTHTYGQIPAHLRVLGHHAVTHGQHLSCGWVAPG